jgi:hypothetical protein
MPRRAPGSDRRVVVLACRHLREAANLAEAHLKRHGAWADWQARAFLTGECETCRRRRLEDRSA